MFVDGSKIRGGCAYRQHTSFKNFIRNRDNYTCQQCGKPAHEVHHIIPYAVCHESTPDNMCVMCRRCNLALRRQPGNARPTLNDWFDWLADELRQYTTPTVYNHPSVQGDREGVGL